MIEKLTTDDILASAIDIANSWARELCIPGGTIETLPNLIDRLWATNSERFYDLYKDWWRSHD